MATEGTKLQVNFKNSASDPLINIYAVDHNDLQTQLAAVQALSAMISSTASALTTAFAGVPAPTAQALLAQSLGATPVQRYVVPVQQYAPPAPVAYNPNPAQLPDNQCKHGLLVWRESKPEAPKAWKGWFCPSAKGTPDQCEPKFLR
jgi:hypothetical protein